MPSELDTTSLVPLYQQIMDDIRRDIASGLYLPGQQIPSEIELGDIYRVSRVTVRRAVKELESQRRLIKRQGKGTFVDERHNEDRFFNGDIVRSFTETCRDNGATPGAVPVSRGIVSMDPRDAAFFGPAARGLAVQIKRVRTADGRPLMVEDNLFDSSIYRFLLDVELADVSIFRIIAERTGHTPQVSDACTLSMERADAESAELLRAPVDEPLFSVAGRYVDELGRPMFIGTQYIVGRHYRFRL